MPKKTKARKNAKNRDSFVRVKALVEKTDEQEYAKVTKKLGNSRFNCECFDGKERLCVIRGSIKKFTRLEEGEYVIVSIREFQDDKGDIIHKLSSDDVKILQNKGEIPMNLNEGKTDALGFIFVTEEIDLSEI